MRHLFALLLCLILPSFALAQDAELTPNEIALQRIEEARASGARTLDLYNLGLEALPAAIGNLTNLEFLRLDENNLSQLPPEFANLVNLQKFFARSNQMIELPSELLTLRNLRTLELSGNSIATLSPEIAIMTRLQELYLSGNQLRDLPPEIGQLNELRLLSLYGNLLTSLPPEIGNLSSLCYLEISNNQISVLPVELVWLQKINSYEQCIDSIRSDFQYHNNPLLFPPLELAKQGRHAVFDYLYVKGGYHIPIHITLSCIGIIAFFLLVFVWRNRRGKRKRKPSTG